MSQKIFFDFRQIFSYCQMSHLLAAKRPDDSPDRRALSSRPCLGHPLDPAGALGQFVQCKLHTAPGHNRTEPYSASPPSSISRADRSSEAVSASWSSPTVSSSHTESPDKRRWPSPSRSRGSWTISASYRAVGRGIRWQSSVTRRCCCWLAADWHHLAGSRPSKTLSDGGGRCADVSDTPSPRSGPGATSTGKRWRLVLSRTSIMHVSVWKIRQHVNKTSRTGMWKWINCFPA